MTTSGEAEVFALWHSGLDTNTVFQTSEEASGIDERALQDDQASYNKTRYAYD